MRICSPSVPRLKHEWNHTVGLIIIFDAEPLSLRRCVSLRTWRRTKRGVLQRIKTFELSTERKLRLLNSTGYEVVRIYFPAPFGVTVSKVERLQMRCGFNPHISRIEVIRFALGFTNSSRTIRKVPSGNGDSFRSVTINGLRGSASAIGSTRSPGMGLGRASGPGDSRG